MANPHYEFEFKIVEVASVVPSGIIDQYFYDTGDEENGEPVYLSTDGVYAKWTVASLASSLITLVAEVGNESATDTFEPSGSEWVGTGAWSGTLATVGAIITDAWYRAETTVFDSLTAFVGGEEGNNCFRGFLPVQGDADDLKFVNVWQLSSGGSSEFDMDRLVGNDPAWCSMRADGRIESIWKTREEAMEFAGAVLGWLESTGNMEGVDNVAWCSLSDIPAEPEVYQTSGINRQRYWKQDIALDIVYATG